MGSRRCRFRLAKSTAKRNVRRRRKLVPIVILDMGAPRPMNTWNCGGSGSVGFDGLDEARELSGRHVVSAASQQPSVLIGALIWSAMMLLMTLRPRVSFAI